MKPVATISLVLVALAALVLIVPALVLGSYVYAAAVAVVAAGASLLLRAAGNSPWSDLMLVIECTMAVSSLLLRVHPLFPLVSVTLFIYAWNTGHRFAHFDRAPAETQARAWFVLQTLLFSLAPSLAVTLVLAVFLYIHVPLTFGIGLGLSIGALVVLGIFVRVSQAARRDEDP